jgi:hypothetical protein
MLKSTKWWWETSDSERYIYELCVYNILKDVNTPPINIQL